MVTAVSGWRQGDHAVHFVATVRQSIPFGFCPPLVRSLARHRHRSQPVFLLTRLMIIPLGTTFPACLSFLFSSGWPSGYVFERFTVKDLSENL